MPIVLMLLFALDSMQFQFNTYKKISNQRNKSKEPVAGASGSGTPTVDSNTGRLFTQMVIHLMELWVLLNGAHAPAMVLLDLL